MKGKEFNVEYLKADLADEPEILDVLKRLGGDRSNVDINRFVVAKLNDKVIGCVRVKVYADGVLELSSLAVLSEYQKQGIGRELMVNFLRSEKHRPIFLLTSSDKEGFYKKFGFNLVDPDNLGKEARMECRRVKNLPFAKNIQVIAMEIK